MKTIGITVLLFFLFVIFPSIPRVRAILALPLTVTDNNAAGDACYVLAAGNAIWERLAAASDLYHMKRVPMIMLMQSNEIGPYSYTAHTSWSSTQWAVHYLEWRGVPSNKVLLLDEAKGTLGTLSEARNVARSLPPDVKKLVLITSAPHTKRTLMAFRRVLPSNIRVVPFAATPSATSAELYNPIWLEYLKLLVYLFSFLLMK